MFLWFSKKAPAVIAGLFLFSCATHKNTFDMAEPTNNIIFVTTDGKEYALRIQQQDKVTTLAPGQLIYPSFVVTRNADLPGAGLYAWEPLFTNVQRPIIPLMFSQFCKTNFATNPRLIYKFSTPYMIERGAKPGSNPWPALIAPYTNWLDYSTSSYNPAGFESFAFSGNINFFDYEKIPFASHQFKTINSPDGAIPAVNFDPTHNVTAYVCQTQQTTPFPMFGTIVNDYKNTITIGYNPGFARVDLEVSSVFVYFELLVN